MCNHKFFNNNINIKAISVVFFMPYNKNDIKVSFTTLLNEERGGLYKGQYNMTGDKVDP